MDYEDLIVSCKNCGVKHPVSQMKMDRPNANLLCSKCYSQMFTATGERIIQKAETDRIKFKCTYCSYDFSRTKDTNFSGICPYCGKQSVKEESSQEMLFASPSDKKLTDY